MDETRAIDSRTWRCLPQDVYERICSLLAGAEAGGDVRVGAALALLREEHPRIDALPPPTGPLLLSLAGNFDQEDLVRLRETLLSEIGAAQPVVIAAGPGLHVTAQELREVLRQMEEEAADALPTAPDSLPSASGTDD